MKYIQALMIAFVLFVSAASAQTFNYDPAHTHAYFRADHLGISYTFGRFNEMMATLTYDADDVSNSSLTISILTESVDTGVDLEGIDFDGARRNGHLSSPDFFDAAQFPTIDFVSSSISPTDDPDVFNVTGNLTMHGVTNEITTTVTKTGEASNPQGKKLIGFYTEFTIDRTDYGMNNLLDLTGPEILVMFSFEGVEE